MSITGTTATTISDTGYSSSQKAAYLNTASHMVLAQLGFDKFSMNYEQRLVYNKALSLVIIKYASKFSDQAVENAKLELKKNFSNLEDTGFDLSLFGSAFADKAIEIGGKVAKIGEGALDSVANTATVLKYALPVLVVGGLALFIWFKVKRP